MKKALVTGANGFIGSALVRDLAANGIEVVALDREGFNNNIPNEVFFVPFDLASISDVTELLKEHRPDTYFHLAWLGMSGETRGDISLQLKNTEWTVQALRQAIEIGCERFVGAGSIMEYETFAAATQQGNRPGTGFVYGTAKLAAHSLCSIEANRLGIDLVWAEVTNAYGVGEISPRLINSTIRKIINEEPLQFTSGTQNYDFVYIDDVARAFRLIGEKGNPFCHYLIGSSNAKPLREFILEMHAILAPHRKFVFGDVPFTGVNLPIAAFDCSLTEKDTGFKAEIAFDDGLKRTMSWLMEKVK